MTKRNTDMNDNFFAADKMLNVFWKYKLHLIILTVIGIIAGIIFSGPSFITPRFKSQATLYPSNISPYSEESETEQYMQWLSGQDIKDSIIQMYDLYGHYGISKDAPHCYADMMYEYGRNIRCEQTVYDAVQITVFDKDPQVACNIVNSIISLTDNKIRRAQKEKFLEVVPNAMVMVNNINGQIDSLSRRLAEIKEKRSTTGINLISDPEYIDAIIELHSAGETKTFVQEQYMYAISNAARNYTYSNMISSPYPADKKALPIRWVIVVFAGIGMFFLSYLGFLIAENVSGRKKE